MYSDVSKLSPKYSDLKMSVQRWRTVLPVTVGERASLRSVSGEIETFLAV